MADRPVRYKVYTAPARRLKRRKKPSRVLGVLITILGVCVLLLVVWLTLAKLTKPYLISHGESKQIEEIEKQIAELEADNKKLREEIDYIKSPRGIEIEARKLGWVKEGEVAIVVENKALTVNPVQPRTEKKESGWSAFWRKITGAPEKTE